MVTEYILGGELKKIMKNEPHIVPEFWWWIRKVELKYGGHGNTIPVSHCKQLIKYLYQVMPYFKEHGLPRYKHIFSEEYNMVNNFEDKIYTQPSDQRFMLFDFIKDLLHENLIKRAYILGHPEFYHKRDPYYNEGDDVD